MRLYLLAFFYLVCIDLLGAGVVARLFEREQWAMFFVVLACLWLLPMGIGLWRLVTFWTGYHLFLKQVLVREYTARFVQSRFPDARGHMQAAEYLAAILDSPNLSERTKLDAAVMVGELRVHRQSSRWTMGTAAECAFEQAMSTFSGTLARA